MGDPSVLISLLLLLLFLLSKAFTSLTKIQAEIRKIIIKKKDRQAYARMLYTYMYEYAQFAMI